MRVAVFLFLVFLAGCTATIRESDLLRPVKGGTLTADALAKAAPAYAVTQHAVRAADGARLHAVLLTQPGARGTVLYFGGNGYTIGRFGAWTAGIFAPLGVDLMIVDHRGYGLSEGTPSAEALGPDGLAAFDYLAALPGRSAGRIVVHGQSLGSFVAGHVAANRPTGGAVLESSATTTEQWVAAAKGGLPIRIRIDPKLSGRGNLPVMGSIEEPVLLLVGEKDRTTPPSLSRALYDASPLPAGRKAMAVVPRAGHVDVLEQPEAIAAYRAFLARALP